MKELIFTLKQELKSLEAKIKLLKKSRKTLSCGFVPGLADAQFEFRVKHVFRCLLRGRTLDQIENSRLKTTPSPTSTTEIRLHRTLSHMHRKYANLAYNHSIQCHCLECKP